MAPSLNIEIKTNKNARDVHCKFHCKFRLYCLLTSYMFNTYPVAIFELM